MRKSTFTAIAAAALACGGGPRLPDAPKGEKILELRGEIEGAPVTVGADDLAALPRRTVTGRAPASAGEASFEGTSLASLIQRVRPKKKAVIDTLVVRTREGAAIPVPVTMVWQLKPVLVREGNRIALVAWPNAEQRGLDSDPRAPSWWARDVVALELVPWPRTFGAALAPPVGATAQARVGSGVFATRCVACHAVRGAGGTVGPALTVAATALDRKLFDSALGDHAFERQGLGRPDEEQRAQLWAFLQAVARTPKPEQEPGAGDDKDEKKPGAPDWEDEPPPKPAGT